MHFKELGAEDCQSIAELHTKAFSSFFLTSLGKQFLKIFYQSIIKDPTGIAIGIFEEKNLVAFSIGTSKKKGFYSNILKNAAFALLWAAYPHLINNPKKIIRLINSFNTKESDNQNIANSACLLSICVDPSMGKKGYGKKVLAAFEQKAFLNSKTISLSTDAEENDEVNLFYRANGYFLTNEFYQSNRKMNLYYKNYEN